jgi:hypothetical protein
LKDFAGAANVVAGGLAKNSLALGFAIVYNAPHLNLLGEPGQRMATEPGKNPGQRWFQEGTARMLKEAILLGMTMLLALVLGSGPAPAAPEPMFSYTYTFKPGSEPDGFRGLKWQTDIAPWTRSTPWK